MKEVWEYIEGTNQNYQISNNGRVWSVKRQRILATHLVGRESSYVAVPLMVHGRRKNFRLHRILAMAFIPNPLNKPEVNHKNGIKTDNRLSNLEWATASENHKHAFAMGLQIAVRGERHGLSKLKKAQVLQIRNSNQPIGNIASRFKISISTVNRIRKIITWTHV